MNETFHLLLALLAGTAIGLFYFGGLWWTTQKGLVASMPALWFMLSLIVRTAILLAGLYAISQGDWLRTIACLIGILSGRVVLFRLTAAATARGEDSNES